MKKSIICLFMIFCALVSNVTMAQTLTVSSAQGQNPTTLVNNVLAGDGVLLSNAKFNNNAGNISSPQIGTFNYTGNAFPFHSGLVLTTGNVSVAAGPNNTGTQSAAVSPVYVDNSLNALASSTLNGCAALEFDFVAYSDTFAFNYIFGSEEYPEYVGSSYNDVFAFFLTGLDPVTGVTTTKNVALIPGTVTPVMINNVNQNQNTQYYITNNSNVVQYDGYTTRLTASSLVLSCYTYTMHLAVGNVGDNAYDSGVFLEAGSFYSPEMNVSAVYNMPNYGDTLIQNCRESDVTFSLPRPVLTATYHSEFSFGGDAIINQDYEMTYNGTNMGGAGQNNDFTFAQDSSVIRAHIRVLPEAQFADGQVKEAIMYITTIFCDEYYEMGYEGSYRMDTLRFYLVGNDTIQLKDTLYKACYQLDEISVTHDRGTEPLVYSWTPATGINDPNSNPAPANINQNRTYTVIAHDRWNCLADTAEVEVVIFERPEAHIAVNPTFGCSPLYVTLSAGEVPNGCDIVWTMSNDTLQWHPDSVAIIHETLTDPGYYDVNLWLSTAPGCSDSLRLENAIHVSDYPHASFTFAPDEPQNGQNVEFYNYSTGDNISTYHWSFGDGSSSVESDPVHAYRLPESDNMTVRLEVTNMDGCSDDTTLVVPVVDNFAFYVPNSFSPNEDGTNDIFLPRVNEVCYYNFSIYTRTGECIFSTNNLEQGWDGTFKGHRMDQGVYVWMIEYAKYSNPTQKLLKKGQFSLIR